jgi:hypothetical protein
MRKKTSKKKCEIRLLGLGCLLLIAILSYAKPGEYAPTIIGHEKNDPSHSILSGNQPLANRSNLIDNHSAILEPLFVNNADAMTTIVSSEKDLLFEAPEGGGIPLGTPVREANLFLALAAIAYGIVCRCKNRPTQQ